MGVFNKSLLYYNNLKLRTKLILSYAFIILTLLVMGYLYYLVSSNIILDHSKRNIYDLVNKNTDIIDIMLNKVQENATAIISDKDLFDVLHNINQNDSYELLQTNIKMTNILNRYFMQSQEIYTVRIASKSFSFGDGVMYIPLNKLEQSELYKIAKEAEGRLQWIPTYDFASMFKEDGLKDINFDYKYLFSAVRTVNSFNINEKGKAIWSQKDINDRPILIISFKEKILQEVLQDNISVDKVNCYIITDNGQIVSHADSSKLGSFQQPEWFKNAIKNKTGMDVYDVNGKKTLVCYSTSKVTKWITVAEVPIEGLLNNLLILRRNTVCFGVLLIILSVLLALYISGMITNPVKQLIIAINRMGEGQFSTRVQVSSMDEIGYLMVQFNEMNDRISRLIHENYEMQIKEKEAQLMALNLQINPHFLYNTLNTINWLAVENNQKEISSLLESLSTMLQYTLKSNKEIVPFSEDFEWVRCYLHIMENRFEDRFSVSYLFDDVIQNCGVPKLFLQPIVENAIIHGFESIQNGGVLIISGRIQADTVIFTIEDNGKGMSPEKVSQILCNVSEAIGISNVQNRIKILFGDKYGISIISELEKGTKVKIVLPHISTL